MIFIREDILSGNNVIKLEKNNYLEKSVNIYKLRNRFINNGRVKYKTPEEIKNYLELNNNDTIMKTEHIKMCEMQLK